MNNYSIKIRCFPSPAELEEWLKVEPTEWTWGFDEPCSTEYGRPITDERGREGVSVKLLMSTSSDLDPSVWAWDAITGLEQDRVEFVRATRTNDVAMTRCYQCEKTLPESQAWRDYDNDTYCSRECIIAYCEEDEPYMKDPDGKIYNA